MKANCGVLNTRKKRTKMTILSKEEAQYGQFRSFFGRIEDSINSFQGLLTFSVLQIRTTSNQPCFYNMLFFTLRLEVQARHSHRLIH